MTHPSGTAVQEDKDFVIRVVQYLQNTCGIVFFITTTDFDTMYGWYEKRIPMRIIKESIARVIERWKKKDKTVKRLSSFKYEVDKSRRAAMELQVGSGTGDGFAHKVIHPAPPEISPEVDPLEEEHRFADIDNFLDGFPNDLLPLKAPLELLCVNIKNNNIKEKECESESAKINTRMLEMFKDDEQLNMKTTVFLRNLAPELRKPELENRYRVNYLLNKYKVPDFAGFF